MDQDNMDLHVNRESTLGHERSSKGEFSMDQDNMDLHVNRESTLGHERSSRGEFSEENLGQNVDLPPFSGQKFENKINDCYVNAPLNLLLSSNEIRKGILESVCHCGLCKYLRKVI